MHKFSAVSGANYQARESIEMEVVEQDPRGKGSGCSTKMGCWVGPLLYYGKIWALRHLAHVCA